MTREKLDILRKADAIYLEEIRKAGLYDTIWQAFAVLLPVRTVGVMGDGRTYDQVCALRAVTSVDGMTADFFPFDMALPRPRRDAHHQRGARHQPRRLRRDVEAAGDDRVGVSRRGGAPPAPRSRPAAADLRPGRFGPVGAFGERRMGQGRIRVGVAGWSVPSAMADRFPATGSHLERYAARFDAVEINSSFYRPHRRATYARWAASVPDDFRFAVKLPKAITHERRLVACADLLDSFADAVGGLGAKRGPVLVQLPPSLAFVPDAAEAFLAACDATVGGPLVCEPRHPSWFGTEAEALLARRRVARVAADPAPVPAAARPGGWNGLGYRACTAPPPPTGRPTARPWPATPARPRRRPRRPRRPG